MLPAESTTMQAALTRLSTVFSSTSVINDYIRDWIADCKAESEGNFPEFTANMVPQGIVACTAAVLPTAVGDTGDEYIVTDATVLTDGSTVVGGGANRVLVRSNGTNWLIV